MTPPSTRAWRPSGIVTLLTDFGLEDTYVGIMKGVLHARCAGLRALVDLTHSVPPQDVRAAAFHLLHSWRWFPSGTVHVAVVDPGVGSGRPILCVEHEGHAFLAPDNGLLAPIVGARANVRRLAVERFALPSPSRTFHGRDVFAPAAARLADGLDPAEGGDPLSAWTALEFPAVRAEADGALAGEVLLVDRFGNLVTNVGGASIGAAPADWTAEIGGRAVPVRGTYAEAQPGELVALIDSYGLVEVAVRDGSAARKLGLDAGEPVKLRRRVA